ncbi:hypothetical protein AAG570_001866 [Ranatra chinensis]|uniref:Uncharacterized protein n=1 Tax=Ranatra chinensis TaxID=642074 RepID=A0ABD0Y9R8_9HEMI
METVPLPDFKIGDISGRGVTLSSLKTLKRTSDAYSFISRDGGLAFAYSVNVRLDKMLIEVGDFKLGNLAGKTEFLVEDNEIYFGYTLFLKDECRARLDGLRMTRVDNVVVTSDNPELDNMDVSELFSKHVVPYVNSKLATEYGDNIFKRYISPCM